jgi:uncharacterized protein YecE (DUF72 family)
MDGESGQVRIGISGWTYPPWRGVFFPKGLVQKRELTYAAGIFRSIEINGTFYGLQRPEAFGSWAEQVPEDFVFSVKAPRFITHILRLRDAETPIANFLASGLLRLGPRLGPILWQFPPSFRFDPDRMAAFLRLLPRDTEAAAALASRHDARMDGRDWAKTDAKRPLRHAVEIRHDSFVSDIFLDLLRATGTAIVCADSVEWPRITEVTADFVYCRLHGSEALYASGYDPAAIASWATRVRGWRDAGRDVFVYFDNDMKVRAPHDAQALMAALEGQRASTNTILRRATASAGTAA